MATELKIGIVGLGYVGKAIRYAYENRNQLDRVYTFDINPDTNPTCASIDELTSLADIIYVAVPTPMTNGGICDLSIVEQVVGEICESETKKIIVLKSTMTPGTTERLQQQYPNHTFFFCPEFLTERNFIDDYLYQDLMILGMTKNSYRSLAEVVLQEQLSVCDVRVAKIIDVTAAEFYKYVANNFLATKVSFANEMESIAKEIGINWDDITNTIINDKRLGHSHWQVPGPDGRRGFGGTCVKPDTKILVVNGSTEIQNLSVDDEVLSVNESFDIIDTKKILSVHIRDFSDEMYEFELPSGKKFLCTPDHLMPVVRDGINLLLPAKDVRLTDFVYTYIKR